jgi:phytoene dehydrogenase-like protein
MSNPRTRGGIEEMQYSERGGQMSKKYDAIIIGGGPGGISCGALLSKWGARTLVIEKNDTVGGKAVTPTNKDGFAYELGPKLQVPAQGPSFAKIFKELGMESQLKQIPLDTAMLGYRGPSGKYRLNVQPASTGLSPEPFFETWGLEPSQHEIALNFMIHMATLTPEQISALDDVTSLDWYRSLPIPNLPSQVESYVRMHANASLAVPVDLVSASEQLTIMQDIALRGAAGYYVGGFGRVLADIGRAMKALGGDIVTRARVQKIKVSNGRVTGVTTDQDTFEAPIVISDAGIQPTVLKLVGEKEFDQAYVNWAKDIVPSWGFTGVKYFLNKKVLKQQMYDIWADDTTMDMQRFLDMRNGKIGEDVIVFATVPSNWDPNMAPPGKQCVVAGTICSPDPKAREIAELHQKLDRMWDKLFPGFMDAVMYKEEEGPAEVSEFTRDSVMHGQGGECVGMGQLVGQCGRHTPSPRAPIGGLFYTGFDVGVAGMGTHRASGGGIKTARMVMEYKRLRQAMT